MTLTREYLILPLAMALSACGDGADQRGQITTDQTESQSVEPEPDEGPRTLTVEGRVSSGIECPVVQTPGGDAWALSVGEADVRPSGYVTITGTIAEMSICQQGRGTIEVDRISPAEPPARDRDPARSGGAKLTTAYLSGQWVAKGLSATCRTPDFSVRRTSGGLVLEGDISNHDDNALIVLGDYPRLDLDEPRQDLPLESRGPDGLAILRPSTDAAYEPISIGSARIDGDGVVFIKCPA